MRRKGLSFLEVLLAVVILSLALVPIMNWLPTSIRAKAKAERQTTAIFLAQSKMEELRNKIVLDKYNRNYREDSAVFPGPYNQFYYSVTDDRGPRLKVISVKVWHVESPQNAVEFFTQVYKR